MANPRRRGNANGKAESTDAAELSASPDLDSLSQVRDLLFGAEVRALEERRQQLEQSFDQSMAQLRRDMDEHLSALDSKLESHRKQFEQLLERERNAREKTAEQNAIKLKDIREAIKTLKSETATSDAELHEHVSAEVERLSTEARALHDEAMIALSEASESLGSDKTDRMLLAQLLQDLAGRLERGE
jgi:chromosome segregation ATPase